MNQSSPILEVENLETQFHTTDGIARAVDGVSFDIYPGETLGLVGESGCGKSVTALSVMQLLKQPPARITGGRIRLQGEDLLALTRKQMKKVRGKRIAMIFQEPMTSLNPVYTIGDQIAEMLTLHENMDRRAAWDRAVDMLNQVQIPSPEKRAHSYPHQLSGGMRQRAMIAMALSCNPQVLIADEPTTALDVTIQAQTIDLMMQLGETYHTAILLITHDLGLVAQTTRRVVVMYTGRVVESAPTLSVFKDPRHPYTQGLMKSLPQPGLRTAAGRTPLNEIEGMVPNLFHMPPGCSFHPRCPRAGDVCRQEWPSLKEVGPGHMARCHFC